MAADQPPITADETRQELDRLTRQVIGAAQRVSSVLGEGFLEKIYENALLLELKKRGVRAEQQCPVHVRYEGEIIGDYMTDLLVEGRVVVELKTVTFLDRIHRSQCVNYLRATGLPVCLLMNFGCRRLEVRRIVLNF
ncbi:MAG: GxxExxY protein [Usitatibacter sp.]